MWAAPGSPGPVGCLSGPGQGLRGLYCLSFKLGFLWSLRPLWNRCLFYREDAGQLLEVGLGWAAVSEASGSSLRARLGSLGPLGFLCGLTVVSRVCGISLFAELGSLCTLSSLSVPD